MSKENETQDDATTEGYDSTAAGQRVDADAIFDPSALLRSLTEGPAKPQPKPQPRSQPRQQIEPDPDEEPDEANEEEQTEEEQPDEEQQEEETTTDDVIKDPEAFLKAHAEMKQKGKVRDELLTDVKALLGAKDPKEVKAKLAALREAATSADIPRTTPTVQRPLASIGSEQEMAAAIDYWEKQLAWCAENSEGGVYEYTDSKGKPAAEDVDSNWVKNQREYAVKVLTKDVPARRKFLDELKRETAKADPVYPFFAANAADNVKAPLMEYINDLDEHVPEFRHYPRMAQLLGDATVGALLRTGKFGLSFKEGKVQVTSLTGNGKSPAASAPVKKLPPVSIRTGSVPGRKATPSEAAADRAAIKLGDGDRAGAFSEMILQQIHDAAAR